MPSGPAGPNQREFADWAGSGIALMGSGMARDLWRRVEMDRAAPQSEMDGADAKENGGCNGGSEER